MEQLCISFHVDYSNFPETSNLEKQLDLDIARVLVSEDEQISDHNADKRPSSLEQQLSDNTLVDMK